MKRITFFLFLFIASAVAQKPLKVFILAGQSNMVGSGDIGTIGYMKEDPQTKALYDLMTDKKGAPVTAERVWISSLSGKMNQYGGVGQGKLTAGYGARRSDPTKLSDKIGPEYAFGLTMQEAYGGPILIIKTAWGGQSLSIDYRPPGAGSYVMNPQQERDLLKKGKLAEVKEKWKVATGRNYRYMIEHIQAVLKNPKAVCPEYDPRAGYEVAGFVWFHGWNDYADTKTYQFSEGNKQYQPYSDVLEQFIIDVRKDLKAPKMPFVIGVLGMFGDYTKGSFNPVSQGETRMKRFRAAQAAPAQKRILNAVAVQTAPFHETRLGVIDQKLLKVKKKRTALQNEMERPMSKEEVKKAVEAYRAELVTEEESALWERATSTGGFVHYFGSAKFYSQAGEAFAKALMRM